PLPLEGMGLRGVFHMHTLDDAIAARAAVEGGVQRAVIIGGGYIGLEMAEAFHYRGIHTSVVAGGGGVLAATLDAAFSARLAEAIQGLGVDIVFGERVRCLGDEDGRVHTVGCDDLSLPADIVIVA